MKEVNEGVQSTRSDGPQVKLVSALETGRSTGTFAHLSLFRHHVRYGDFFLGRCGLVDSINVNLKYVFVHPMKYGSEKWTDTLGTLSS